MILVLAACGLANSWRYYWFIHFFHFIHFILSQITPIHPPCLMVVLFILAGKNSPESGLHYRQDVYRQHMHPLAGYFPLSYVIFPVWNLVFALFNPTLFPSKRSLFLVVVHSTFCWQVGGLKFKVYHARHRWNAFKCRQHILLEAEIRSWATGSTSEMSCSLHWSLNGWNLGIVNFIIMIITESLLYRYSWFFIPILIIMVCFYVNWLSVMTDSHHKNYIKMLR
jgi:hypothetical protein